MKKEILVDIDIIVEYLKTGKGKLPEAYEKFRMKILSTTYTELLSSTTFNDSTLEGEVMEFVKKYFSVINVDTEIAIKASEVLRKHDVSLATALNAATSITRKLELLTESKSNYKEIVGVELLSL